MLIHGRLILTASGLMLDEVKSLLQKSLRRKDVDLATKAAKELHGRGKDHLHWKSMVTFLFEDHCLNSEQVLAKICHLHKDKDRYGCIEVLLSHCYTCRLAACLPVIAMDETYDPASWDASLPVDDELQGLLLKAHARIDFNLLLQHLKDAWVSKEVKLIITYIKMATMVADHDSRSLSQKGLSYCLFSDRVKPTNVTAVILSMLSKCSLKIGEKSMQAYTKYCCYLSTIPDVPVRLILSAAATQYIHSDKVKQHAELPVGKINWNSVRKLDKMPPWAVDKHTFRGKCGKGTTHILKTPDKERLTPAELEEFHGTRPKQDITHFFTEGVKCEREVMEQNPYWERCQELYMERPKKLQKTIRMTAVYYKEQLKKFPSLKGLKQISVKGDVRGVKRGFGDVSEDDSQDRPVLRVTRKRIKLDDGKDGRTNSTEKNAPPSTSTSLSAKEPTLSTTEVIQEREATEEPCSDGPLLQLPTGSAKMYTRVDLKNKVVWKGPYKEDRVNLLMFLHRALKEIFRDPHTLDVQRSGLYVRFPLLHSADATMAITTRDFYDCIGKQQVKGGQFVRREHLGVIQLHNMSPSKFRLLPATFWCHYMYRYILNVGDSGLYNSITDKDFSFLYGIDMEEIRKNVNGNGLIDLMFVKLPKKEICAEIKLCLKRLRKDMADIMKETHDVSKLTAMATFYGVVIPAEQYRGRLERVRKALERV